MKFYGELGCGLETNWLHLVTIRFTIRIRESVPDHDPDPGRTVTILLCWRSAEVCALWVLLVSLFVRSFIHLWRSLWFLDKLKSDFHKMWHHLCRMSPVSFERERSMSRFKVICCCRQQKKCTVARDSSYWWYVLWGYSLGLRDEGASSRRTEFTVLTHGVHWCQWKISNIQEWSLPPRNI